MRYVAYKQSGSGFLRRVMALWVCISVVAGTLPALSAAEEKTIVRELHIRQETSHEKGILVSRPQKTDLAMNDFLAQNRIRSVEDYAEWLKKNIEYMERPHALEWGTPENLLLKKAGDCEDYAVLTRAVARIFGFQPKFLALLNLKRSHAICTFKVNGVYVWFDNARMIKTEARSLEELAEVITEQYDYLELIEIDIETNEWKLIENRPAEQPAEEG